jgi:hypothetical protein
MTLMIGLHIFFRNVKKMLAKIPCPEWYENLCGNCVGRVELIFL